MKYFFVFVLLLIAASLIYIVNLPKSQSVNKTMNIKIANHEIVADVADNATARTQGLSGRSELKNNAGMLFIYDQPSYPGIWMKEMEFSLDIIFIDEGKKIVDITFDISPNTYPQLFKPKSLAKYVLEVSAGWCKDNDIKIGDEVKF
ncbi:MAG: DUF192 domain-containing protein [Patescibacteria group bacterium]|nr:DUF192 domain-containing protein [Patescibacteria group bacterium]